MVSGHVDFVSSSSLTKNEDNGSWDAESSDDIEFNSWVAERSDCQDADTYDDIAPRIRSHAEIAW